MQCQSCGAEIPDDAQFCIECGARAPVTASTGPTVHLPGVAVACRSCGTANPAGARYCVRCGQPVAAMAGRPPAPQTLARPATPPHYQRRHRQSAQRGGGLGFLFLIGLGAMLLLKVPIWPGILIICGLVAFAAEAMRGRYLRGLSGVVWLFGLAFIFTVPRLMLPGIFVLVGLSVLLEMARRAFGQP